MGQRITIDPVMRIEGHAKITVQLDVGQVTNARFHVTEFRCFEKFCEGRPLWEMPGIMARVSGICPISHQLASSKAGDATLGVAQPAGRREAPEDVESGADRSVARPERLPPERAGPFARPGQRYGPAQYFRPDRGRARNHSQRHPPSPIRPAGHRARGPQEDPSAVVGAGRGPRAALLGPSRRHSHRHSRGGSTRAGGARPSATSPPSFSAWRRSSGSDACSTTPRSSPTMSAPAAESIGLRGRGQRGTPRNTVSS
ncbi:NAD-reducing hydrogenase HoxS subunit beta [Paludisphaera borealis]|uniref:NAD-reducing hydrogenase HoxS subunit beta n=1 Tax=Paludisphaera borealis TaxID=1387353 RepID=A0A1U7CNN7_9BACT|nr:NAD-reducing hydrogenase HoxS subunit beta [Paludisphaera borealis]